MFAGPFFVSSVQPTHPSDRDDFFAAFANLHVISPPPAAAPPDSLRFSCSLAGVAELVDALDLGSSDESCGGSSPSARTTSMSASCPGSQTPASNRQRSQTFFEISRLEQAS